MELIETRSNKSRQMQHLCQMRYNRKLSDDGDGNGAEDGDEFAIHMLFMEGHPNGLDEFPSRQLNAGFVPALRCISLGFSCLHVPFILIKILRATK